MDFLNKVGNMVGKGIDSIKSQINKAQENAFPSPQENTPNLPKGVHILGVIENENEKEKDQNINNNNKYSNFFGIDPNVYSNNNINNNNYNNQINQMNKINLDEQPKKSSSMFDYFQKNSNMQNININSNINNNYNNKDSEPDKEFLSGFELINGEKSINWSRCMLKLEKGPYPCKALLTEYRLYLIPELDKSYLNYFPKGYFSLLIHKIKKINRIQKPQTFEFFLEITMSDERTILLVFKEGINIVENLPHNLNLLLSNLETPLFCQLAIQYNKNNPIYRKENFEDGWNLYNPEKEFQRQGITNLNYEYDQNKLFRKT